MLLRKKNTYNNINQRNFNHRNRIQNFYYLLIIFWRLMAAGYQWLTLAQLKIEFHLKDTHKIYWFQIIGALPKTWKDIVLKDKGNAKKFSYF